MEYLSHVFSNKLNLCLVRTKSFVTPLKENRLVCNNIFVIAHLEIINIILLLLLLFIIIIIFAIIIIIIIIVIIIIIYFIIIIIIIIAYCAPTKV